jgi:hypothetical protein
VRRLMTRLFAVCTAMVAAVAVSPVTAQAAGTATHYATHYLAWQPNSGMASICLPAKRIYLAPGIYDWRLKFGGREFNPTGEALPLSGDYYWWGVCLDPRDGEYRIRSSFDPESGRPMLHISGYDEMMNPPDRNVTWGSLIYPWDR